LTLFCGVVGSGCGWISGKGRGAEAAGPKKPAALQFRIPVTVERLSRGPMNAYLQAVGTIRPIKEIEVKAEMSGRIYFQKRWEDGDYVDARTLLARIDDTTVQLDLREAERALELAQQSLIPAQAAMERRSKEAEFAESMWKRGAYSEVQYQQARLNAIQAETTYQQALTTIETRRTQIEKMKKELEKTDIYSQFAGILLPAQPPQASQASAQETDLTLLEGTLVGAAQTVLRLADIRQVVVELDVPAKDIDLVDLGQTVELDIYSKAGRQYIGTVQDISSTLNPTTRTYTVKVNVDNPLSELRPGMFSKARIITETRLDAISIARELVMLRNNKHVVFVVQEKAAEDEPASATATVSATAEVAAASGEPAGVKPQPSGDRRLALAAVSAASGTVVDPSPPIAAGTVADATDEKEEAPPKVMVAGQREVKLGIENRERVEITDGLKDGDLLVVLGYETLTEGVEVSASTREPGEKSETQEEDVDL
jgi:RND family efflux transporter MFP subunit